MLQVVLNCSLEEIEYCIDYFTKNHLLHFLWLLAPVGNLHNFNEVTNLILC